LLFYVALVGCGFHRVGGGDGGHAPGDDFGDGSYGGGDMRVGDGSDVDTAGGAACPRPQLLVAIADTRSGDVGGGAIARFALATGSARACTPLVGQQRIGALPVAVAAFGSHIAAVTNHDLYIVDPDRDIVTATLPNVVSASFVAVDAFALQDAAGHPAVAAAFGIAGSPPAAREIFAFGEDGKPLGDTPWCIQASICATDLMLSIAVFGMTTDPVQPTHLLVLDSETLMAAASVDPYRVKTTQYVGDSMQALVTIYSARFGTTPRLAWIASGFPSTIVWANDDGKSATPTIHGGLGCSSLCDVMVHVVPDPMSADHFYVLCEATTYLARRVFDLDTAGSCTQLLDGALLGPNTSMTRLAIAP
jgi:hypothetical protein